MTPATGLRVGVIAPELASGEAVQAILQAYGFVASVITRPDALDALQCEFVLVVANEPEALRQSQSGRVVAKLPDISPSTVDEALRDATVLLAARVVLNVKRASQRERPLSVGLSFEDLHQYRLLVPPPFMVASGPPADGMPLVLPDAGASYVTAAISAGRQLLVTGPPGLGKSTSCLQTLFALTTEGRRTNILYLRGRDFASDSQADQVDLFRIAITGPDLPPWPVRAPVHESGWIVIFDGLDEWRRDHATVDASIRGLLVHAHASVVSCRQHEITRDLRQIVKQFDQIVRLTEWQHPQIDQYVAQLKLAGRDEAARYIAKRNRPPRRSLVSVPLWLTMLAYLAETKTPSSADDDYGILIDVTTAVASAELKRFKVKNAEFDDLQRLWSQVAWQIHQSRRNSTDLFVEELATLIRCDPDGNLFKAVISFLDVSPAGRVSGFYHEVFLEFHLARFILDLLERKSKDVLTPLGYQRSVLTNRFIRAGMKASVQRQSLIEFLTALHSAPGTGDRTDFVRGQIIYFIARVGNAAGTNKYLADIWRSPGSLFVKQAAAWGAILNGETDVEAEYYRALAEDTRDAAANADITCSITVIDQT